MTCCPMRWAPGAGGELLARDLNVQAPLPAHEADWCRAAGWAQEFWTRVADDARVSPAFAAIARAAGGRVTHVLKHL